MELSFKEMEKERGDIQVVWEWIGEGYDGDFDDDDPDDVALLRFSAYVRVTDPELKEELGYGHETSPWVPADDASYCTQMPVETEPEILEAALEIILARFEGDFRADDPPSFGLKGAAEDLSWLEPKDVKRALAAQYRQAPPAPDVGEIGERSRESGLAEGTDSVSL